MLEIRYSDTLTLKMYFYNNLTALIFYQSSIRKFFRRSCKDDLLHSSQAGRRPCGDISGRRAGSAPCPEAEATERRRGRRQSWRPGGHPACWTRLRGRGGEAAAKLPNTITRLLSTVQKHMMLLSSFKRSGIKNKPSIIVALVGANPVLNVIFLPFSDVGTWAD